MSKRMLTKKEREILEIFWAENRPLAASHISLIDSGISNSTARSTIKRLEKKDLLKVAKIDYVGTVLTQYYQPTIDLDDYILSGLSDTEMSSLFVNYVDNYADVEELDYLESLIKKRRTEMG